VPIPENIEINEVDIDAEMDMARAYNIRGVPTLVLLDDEGNEVKRHVGNASKDQLIQLVS